jgi:hypothetical protein
VICRNERAVSINEAEPTTQATPTAGAKQQAEAAPETTDAPATSEDQTQETEQQQEPKKKGDGGFQRRINRLTADYRAAEARAAAAEAKAQELERRQATQTQASDNEPRPPRLEDFRSYEEYERADRAYVADKATRDAEKRFKAAETERQASAQREADAKRMREAAERFNKSAEDVAEHYEDLAEVMDDMWRGRVPVIRNNDAIARYIIEESDRGPELAYHLANNADAAERIGRLTPMAQVRELVKLEASLPKPNAPATKAPAPPRTIGSRGGSDTKDPEKMSIDEMRKSLGLRRKVDF